jgi:hypothetical protein
MTEAEEEEISITGCSVYISTLKEGGPLKTQGAAELSGMYSIDGVNVSKMKRAEVLTIAKAAATSGKPFDLVLSYNAADVPPGSEIVATL